MAKKRSPKGIKLLHDAISRASPAMKTVKIIKGSMTKTQLAQNLGMSIEQLRHIEAGRRRPTLGQAVAIEEQLRVPIKSWL